MEFGCWIRVSGDLDDFDFVAMVSGGVYAGLSLICGLLVVNLSVWMFDLFGGFGCLGFVDFCFCVGVCLVWGVSLLLMLFWVWLICVFDLPGLFGFIGFGCLVVCYWLRCLLYVVLLVFYFLSVGYFAGLLFVILGNL